MGEIENEKKNEIRFVHVRRVTTKIRSCGYRYRHGHLTVLGFDQIVRNQKFYALQEVISLSNV